MKTQAEIEAMFGEAWHEKLTPNALAATKISALITALAGGEALLMFLAFDETLVTQAQALQDLIEQNMFNAHTAQILRYAHERVAAEVDRRFILAEVDRRFTK